LEDLLLAPGINEITLVSTDHGYYSGLRFSRAVVVYEEIYEFFSIIIKWPFSG
jgi:hypothetical protein